MGDRVSENSSVDEQFLISTRVQISGVLMKRPFGHQSNKWSKRFFVIKDGFLLYYPENEKKAFEKRGTFNLHPKGVIPLGGCSVESDTNGNYSYIINVCSEEFSCKQISLLAETRLEQEKWMAALKQASRVTWKNAQYEESLIRELETQGLQLTKEKHNYVEKLQEEVTALRNEMDKNEELEKLTLELEKEKSKLQEMIQQLEKEHKTTQKECEETSETLRRLEDDKKQLQQTTNMLQLTLENLAEERERTIRLLRQKEEETQNLYVTSEELQNALKGIEEETKFILDEKTELEQRYFEIQMYAQMLHEEKQIFSEQANQLLDSLNELTSQKQLMEAELKQEILARISAEKRLKNAEESLCHLELLLKNRTNSEDSIITEIMTDVKNLKKYFEDVAEECKLNADKPMIKIRDAILAKKSCVQKSQLLKLELAKQEKVASDDNRDRCALHRTQSMLVSNKTQKKIRTLRRTMSTRNSRGISMQELQNSLPTMEE
ncbi:pleckstrin homology domain-containing family D member 1-like [Centruroides vittatus]|uniref:pleckstrin homology domain-containing family D member 1-like n=1 Tax=Centruroides vittatus TaxID=120091 RepID=UPI003510D222